MERANEMATGVENTSYKTQRTAAVVQTLVHPAPTLRIGPHRVVRFIEENPLIAKILILCNVLSIVSIITTIPKLVKYGKRVYLMRGGERFDAAMKIFAKLGEITTSLATLALGLEAFNFGKKLGQVGLGFAETVYKTVGVWLDTIVLIGTVFSVAQIVIDGRKFWKTRQFLSELEKGEKLNLTEEKRLGKLLQVDGATFKKVALTKDPQELLAKVKGRLKANKTVHLVTSLTAGVTLLATGLLLIPPLHPLVGVLFLAVAVSTFATTLFDQINRYQFEDSLGMIEREQARPNSWKGRVSDFAKWELGWYGESSLLKRMQNVTTNFWWSSLQVGEALAAVLKGMSRLATKV